MSEQRLIAKRADYQTSHVMHLILSILTVGLWVPIWALCAISNSLERSKIDRKLERAERPD